MATTFIRVPCRSDGLHTGESVQYRVIRVTSDIWRRHSVGCKVRSLGRQGLRCDCPLWGDGYIDSDRVLRQSLDTRSLDDAQRRLDKLIEERVFEMFPPPRESQFKSDPGVSNEQGVRTAREPATATEECSADDPSLIRSVGNAFLQNCETNGIKSPTLSKYRNVINQIVAYAESEKVQKPLIEQFDITDLDGYRASRKIAKITSLKELETLRQLWDFATVRGLCKVNIARQVKAPRISEHNKIVPYATKEVAAIFRACDTFGQYEYERKRAKAMTSMLRFTSLRISDIALMRKDRISRHAGGYEIFLRTTKNNEAVLLPVPKQMMDALDALPTPRGASDDCPYFFWNGKSKPKSMISVAEETLAAVFRKSGVKDAGAHRFRHTLATELLGEGASFEEVADILGNSPAIVRKHYAKWSRKRQARVRKLMRKVHGTSWKRN